MDDEQVPTTIPISGGGELTYYLSEETPWFREGVTSGWLVMHSGVGPGRAVSMAVLRDGDGETAFELTGEWQDITVTA